MIIFHTLYSIARIVSFVLAFTATNLVRFAWIAAILGARLFRWMIHSKERFWLSMVGGGFALLLALVLLQEIIDFVRFLMLAIFMVISSLLQALLHPWSLFSLPGNHNLQLAAALAALSILALLLARLIFTEITLRTRVAYAVLPSAEFNPSEEQIQSFASHLVGMRRRLWPGLDRPACAFRVWLTTTGEPIEKEEANARPPIKAGLPLMIWEFPASFKHLLEVVATSYPGVELVPLEEFSSPPAQLKSQRCHQVCLELEPADDLYALKSLPYPTREGNGVDPLQSVAVALSGVEAKKGEHLELAVDFLPLSPGEAARARHVILQKARRLDAHKAPKGDFLLFEERIDTALQLQQRFHKRAVTQKLGDPKPLFGLQVLIKATAYCEGRSWRSFVPGIPCCSGECRAKSMAGRVYASFEQFGAANYFRAKGLSIFGLLHLGSGLPFARQWFEYRLQRGLVS